jgi:hypothetical protein
VQSAFSVPPDIVFLTILHTALALQQGYVEELMEMEEGPASRWWPVTEPMIARFFDPPTAVRLIERLLAASRDTQLYQLTDYHWLTIYRRLETFCDLHNDEAANDPSGRAEVGPYSIGSIDLDAIVDLFSDECSSIAAGLKPPPSAVGVQPWPQDDAAWLIEDDRFPAEGVIVASPPQD